MQNKGKEKCCAEKRIRIKWLNSNGIIQEEEANHEPDEPSKAFTRRYHKYDEKK